MSSDFTSQTVFVLLLDKSAIGVYTTYEKAGEASAIFLAEQSPANENFEIKPFQLDGLARIFKPY